MGWWFKDPALETYSSGLSRDVLIQSGRILFVDDEVMPLIEELRRTGFSVNHDTTGNEFEPQVSAQYFDVAILDYSGVGQKYGPKQGLDLLRHIRRVSPRTRIIAYTSRSLSSVESDFYRMADRVLAKDAGVAETLEVVEEQLQRAFSKQHLFDSLVKSLDVTSDAGRKVLKTALEKALKEKDQSPVKAAIKKVVGKAADKGMDVLLSRIFIG